MMGSWTLEPKWSGWLAREAKKLFWPEIHIYIIEIHISHCTDVFALEINIIYIICLALDIHYIYIHMLRNCGSFGEDV